MHTIDWGVESTFNQKVCNKLQVSKHMMNRSRLIFEDGCLTVKVCTSSDILLFKSITNRDGDLEDSISLIERGDVDWNVVLDEIWNQLEDGENVWISWITDRLLTLSEEYNISIPIINQLINATDQYSQ